MTIEPWVNIILGVLTLLGVLATAALVYLAAQGKNRNEHRRDNDADRNALLETFKESVTLYGSETKELRAEVGELRKATQRSTEIISEHIVWGNRAVVVFDENGLRDKIPRPAPTGIHI